MTEKSNLKQPPLTRLNQGGGGVIAEGEQVEGGVLEGSTEGTSRRETTTTTTSSATEPVGGGGGRSGSDPADDRTTAATATATATAADADALDLASSSLPPGDLGDAADVDLASALVSGSARPSTTALNNRSMASSPGAFHVTPFHESAPRLPPTSLQRHTDDASMVPDGAGGALMPIQDPSSSAAHHRHHRIQDPPPPASSSDNNDRAATIVTTATLVEDAHVTVGIDESECVLAVRVPSESRFAPASDDDDIEGSGGRGKPHWTVSDMRGRTICVCSRTRMAFALATVLAALVVMAALLGTLVPRGDGDGDGEDDYGSSQFPQPPNPPGVDAREEKDLPFLDGYPLLRVGTSRQLEGAEAGDEFGTAVRLGYGDDVIIGAPGGRREGGMNGSAAVHDANVDDNSDNVFVSSGEEEEEGTGTAQVWAIESIEDDEEEEATTDEKVTTATATANATSLTSTTPPPSLTVRIDLLLSTPGDAIGDRAGTAMDATTFGDHVAIGYPSTVRRGYVKVYIKDKETNTYSQVGETLYGEGAADGYGSSIALSQHPKKKGASVYASFAGLSLAVGSNAGYVHLWRNAVREDTETLLGEWARLDLNGELDQREATDEVVVAKAGTGLRLFVGYPNFGNGRGIVKAYTIEAYGPTGPDKDEEEEQEGQDAATSGEQRIDLRQLGETLWGDEEGDRFGAALSVDRPGGFAAIGTRGGGYVKTVTWDDRIPGWNFVGEKIGAVYPTEAAMFGSAVATGRVPFGSCVLCPPTLDGRRIIVGSPGYDGRLQVGATKGTAANNAAVAREDIGVGRARVYQFIEADFRWVRIGGDIVGEAVEEGLGMEVAMDVHSEMVAVGSPLANSQRGRVTLYRLATE